jgi:Ser/Thr protein kinase RdoA (MazF antagonist)
MGLEAAPPDWPPLTTEEVRQVLEHVPALEAGTANIRWHSPRPFSSCAIVSLPTTPRVTTLREQPRALRSDRGPTTQRGPSDDGHDDDRYDCSRHSVVVKRQHGTVRTVEDLHREHDLLRYLAGRGVPVPHVYSDGIRSAWQEGDFVYEVQGVLAGHDLYLDAPSWTPFLSPAHAHASGRALARLHLASSGYQAPARPGAPLLASCRVISSDDPVSAIEDLASERPGLADFLSPRRWQGDIERALVPLQELFSPYVQALAPLWGHNDWHPSNLVWSTHTTAADVSGVFDFGLCNLTTACYDLATAIERSTIGWLHPPGDRQVHTGLVRALLDGYRSVRQIGPQEVAALPHLLPIVHVDYALSEVEYFHAVVRSPSNALLAYEDYLLGHLEWFTSPEGLRLCTDVVELLTEAPRWQRTFPQQGSSAVAGELPATGASGSYR